MQILVYALGVIAVILGLEAVSAFLRGRELRNRDSTRRRLKSIADRLTAPGAIDEESLLKSDAKRGNLLERLLGAIPGRDQLELRLYRAGLSVRPERFLFLSAALGFGGWFLGLVFLEDPVQPLLLIGLGVLPWVQMARFTSKRIHQFEQQFPDALDLLIRSLRAGHSLSTGFQMVGNELPEPIGPEFAHVADEVHLGKTMNAALANLAFRVESSDLPFFITAISIQQETGSNLAEVLENLSGVMRDRFKLLGKVRALTAMGRASASLLAVWPLVTVGILAMVNPGYVAPLWETQVGHTIVMIATLLVIIGYIICRKMATIRV